MKNTIKGKTPKASSAIKLIHILPVQAQTCSRFLPLTVSDPLEVMLNLICSLLLNKNVLENLQKTKQKTNVV